MRYEHIPAGFCYQKLLIGDTIDSGYCIHALNAVHISSIEKWMRIDARGNTNGVDAQFLIDHEQVAFPVRPEFKELDYPTVFSDPSPVTVKTLESNTDCIEMFAHLPKSI